MKACATGRKKIYLKHTIITNLALEFRQYPQTNIDVQIVEKNTQEMSKNNPCKHLLPLCASLSLNGLARPQNLRKFVSRAIKPSTMGVETGWIRVRRLRPRRQQPSSTSSVAKEGKINCKERRIVSPPTQRCWVFDSLFF